MNTHTPILLRDLDIYPDILFDFYLKAADVDGFEAEIRRLQTDRTYAAAAAARSAKGADFYSRDHVRRHVEGVLQWHSIQMTAPGRPPPTGRPRR